MFRICAAAVRSLYLLSALTSATFGSWLLLRTTSGLLQPRYATHITSGMIAIAALLLACVIPSVRALARLLRSRELLPDAHLRERPVITLLVALPATLGLVLLCFVLRVWIDILPWGTEAGGPIAGTAGLGMLLLAFVMLTGEMVLVGRSAQPSG